jgi:hypothetical protein
VAEREKPSNRTKTALNDDVWTLLRNDVVYGFDWRDGGWDERSGGTTTPLAKLLDYNKIAEGSTSDWRESSILCAPLTTRDGALGILKVAARYPGSFSKYEATLVQQFMPLAAVAIQNSQRTVTLEAKMLEAEKKHAVANLLRGVSHDVNNALGCVLPLIQQIASDVQLNRLQGDTLSQDVQQIEQSIQTCRRTFGGMLALARGASQGSVQANVRRALDSTLAVLRDSLERQGISDGTQVGGAVGYQALARYVLKNSLVLLNRALGWLLYLPKNFRIRCLIRIEALRLRARRYQDDINAAIVSQPGRT